MDVTQINIKINQNKQLSGGKHKTDTQTDSSISSFDQILAMFNISGKSPGQDQQAGANTEAENMVDPTNKGDDKTISAEDWAQLASILPSCISGGIQQGDAIPGVGNTNTNPTVNGTANLANSPQVLSEQVKKALSQWLEMATGDHPSTKEPEELIRKLSEFTQSEQRSSQVPSDILTKIEQLLSNIKTDNQKGDQTIQLQVSSDPKGKSPLNLDVLPSITQTQIKTDNLQDNQTIQLQVSTNTKGKSPLILDKNQVLQTIPQTQMPNGSYIVKAETAVPSLPVSQVVPEVTQLAGRLMTITGGQSGSTEAKFNLFPEHLGPIEIKVTSQDGQVSAQIVTDTPIAKTVLEGQVQNLREALQQQGLLVQKLDIVQQISPSPDANQTSLSFSQGGGASFSNGQRSFTADQQITKKNRSNDPQQIETDAITNTYGASTIRTAASIDFTA